MRDDVEGRVHAAEDAVRDDALDQRTLGHALDRLQPIANELRQEDHQRRHRDRPLGQRCEDAEDRSSDSRAHEGAADPRCVHDPSREQRSDKRADASRRDDDPEQERIEVQLA